MADKGTQDELTIRRMPDGGYLVMKHGYRGEMSEMCFASTDIAVALEYIRGQVAPIGPEAPK